MITSLQEGLAPEHLRQSPILDRVELEPHGRVRCTRTYADGAQYFASMDPLDASVGSPAWSRFVTITDAGVARIQQIMREGVPVADMTLSPDGPSGGGGQIVWVMYLDGEERVVRTRAGSYDALPPFVRQIDEAVSQNVRRSE